MRRMLALILVGAAFLAACGGRGTTDGRDTVEPAGRLETSAAAAATDALATDGASTAIALHSQQPERPEQGVIKGRILDERGVPVRGKEIEIEISFLSKTVAKVAADRDGRYRIENIPASPYRIFANLKNLEYNGKYYTFSLEPASGGIGQTVDSTKGAVFDWVWRIRGYRVDANRNRTDPDQFHGGSIQVMDLGDPSYRFPVGSSASFTFTPKGALIDGSQGEVVTRTLADVEEQSLSAVGYEDRQLADLPIGRYAVTATVTHPDGRSIPLQLRNGADARSKPAAELTLDFQPKGYNTAPAVETYRLDIVASPDEAAPPLPDGVRAKTGTFEMRNVDAKDIADAVHVAPPATIRSALEPEGEDIDVIAVVLKAGQTLKVELKTADPNRDIAIQLYQPYSESLANGRYFLDYDSGSSFTKNFKVGQTGIYYLKVSTWVYDTPLGYELKLSAK